MWAFGVRRDEAGFLEVCGDGDEVVKALDALNLPLTSLEPDSDDDAVFVARVAPSELRESRLDDVRALRLAFGITDG
jgi:hypothetical protein